MEWKFAIFIATLLSIGPAILVYQTMTDTFTDSSWAAMGSFSRNRIYLAVLGVLASNIVAFFNNTAANTRKQIADRKEGETTFLTRTEVKVNEPK